MEATPLIEPPLVLASASPRRRRLLAWLGMPYDMVETETPEDLESPLASLPPILARSIAAEKAVAARAITDGSSTILAFDTVVVADRSILGKPADIDAAFEMLRGLSGATHAVVTGVAIQMPQWAEPRTFAVTTEVLMNELSEADLTAWAERGELLGCAGAYNIESHLAVVGPDECYQNVAGLPLCHLYHELMRAGYTTLSSPVRACDEARCTACLIGPRIVGRPIPLPRP